MAAVAYLVLTNVHPRVWRGTILRKRQTIGRGRDADVRVPVDFIHVSRQHAEVWSDQKGLWVSDLQSKAGTRVNGVPLLPTRPFQLEMDDRICLGTAELDVKSIVDLQPHGSPHTAEQATRELCEAGATILAQSPEAFQQLTPAELEIVLQMSRGYSLDEICDKLCRSMHTVLTHLRTIFRKLDIHARDQLLASLRRRAIQNGQTRIPADTAQRRSRGTER